MKVKKIPQGLPCGASLGCGMMCFTKEQLREFYDIENRKTQKIYDFAEAPVEDKLINDEILENLKNGFSFTEHLGYMPYFCETCNKLTSVFYFQMELNGNYYVPKYYCHKCKNILEPLNIIWEKNNQENDENTSRTIEIKYKMLISKDNIVKILSDINEEKRLICKWCNNNEFIMDENVFRACPKNCVNGQ